ncbi:toll/interleukin-1 receptor domain-containing protein [Candidatus Acetothermia bacterium]|nr:toll/interleukin-1 receptor domain-containing protein [Candidatus Acetothermia bacterium]
MTAIRLFISHSSKDMQLAGSLVELLRAALNLPASEIRCTSVKGYGLPGGVDTDEQLLRELRDAEAFIGILSSASMRSMYVLFELGARWGSRKHLIPLLAPATPASALSGPISGLNALSAENVEQLVQLVSQIGSALHIKPKEPSEYKSYVDKVSQTPPDANGIGAPPEGKYKFRRADPGDIDQIHRLALKAYGFRYRFSDARLREWWSFNPKCFFVMLCDSVVVGYIDAFPITEDDYRHLLAGKDEQLITPQAVGRQLSFYIASIVIAKHHRGNTLRFLHKASRFYEKAYPEKLWGRVCAIAYTPNGLRWVTKKGMFKVENSNNSNMWCIDRHSLPNLGDENRAFWRPLFGHRDTP